MKYQRKPVEIPSPWKASSPSELDSLSPRYAFQHTNMGCLAAEAVVVLDTHLVFPDVHELVFDAYCSTASKRSGSVDVAE